MVRLEMDKLEIGFFGRNKEKQRFRKRFNFYRNLFVKVQKVANNKILNFDNFFH